MASGIYNGFYQELGSGNVNLSTDTLVVHLCSSGYTFDPDHRRWVTGEAGGPFTNEIAGTGYASANVATQTWTRDDANNRAEFDGDNPFWSGASFTARYAIIEDETHASDILVCCYDFGSDQTVSAGIFSLAVNANGFFMLSTAA